MERNRKSIKFFGVEITSKEDFTGRKIKKGNPWIEEEHIAFLKGLDFHGKGNWTKIAKDFVPSRTSTQVASHAQKYFLRLLEKKKCKKSSVFDLHLEKIENTVSLGNNEESHNVAPNYYRVPTILPLTWVYMYPYHHHYDASASTSVSSTTFDKPISGISSYCSSSKDSDLELIVDLIINKT